MGLHSIQRHRGAVNTALVVFLISLALLGLLIVMLVNPQPPGQEQGEDLILYCAAGLMPPIEAVARDYEREVGVKIRLHPGPSQSLLANAEVSGVGDLILPADDSYIELARQKNLIDEVLPLATMRPVLVVRQGNPLGIDSLETLIRGSARIAQANPDAAAIGNITRDALGLTGQWDRLAERTLTYKGTVNDVANDIKLGAIDAGIVWDAMLQQYPDLQAIPAPELNAARAEVNIAILRSSKQPTAALRFARYLAARDRGLTTLARFGYTVAEGDEWSAQPELRLYGGAMLRPAVEQTLDAFAQREGIHLTRVYNGCGILVAQMKAGQHPDAYFACDRSFMNQVNDLFLDSTDVSGNQLVILVPKGNVHGISSLKDLGKPKLRIGVGHEQQCALGALTRETFIQSGVYAEVRKNIAVESPTGDLLVNQLRTGSLDAVVAYISNMAPARDELEAIVIDIPCALAVQPYAVARESKNRRLAERLLDAIQSGQSRQQFQANGFAWHPTTQPSPGGR